MQLKVKKAFSWAHKNVHIKEYAKGDVIETEDEDLIRVATEEGWVAKPQQGTAPSGAAEKDASAPDADPAADADGQVPAQ